jgi:hypothetical protein
MSDTLDSHSPGTSLCMVINLTFVRRGKEGKHEIHITLRISSKDDMLAKNKHTFFNISNYVALMGIAHSQ